MAETAHTIVTPLGTFEEAVLLALARYRYLTAPQIARICHFSPRSITHIREKLKLLADAQFLQRLVLPRKAQAGSGKLVFTLGRLGIHALATLGIDVPKRMQPGTSILFLEHTLAVNDVLIAAELLSHAMPQVELITMLHEAELKQTPVSVEIDVPAPNGSTKRVKTSVIPDGILEFVYAGWQDFIVLEVDRGHIEQKRWKQKVRAYVVYANGPHEKTYGTAALTIAVVATGEHRRQVLKSWTEEELTRLHKQHEGERFFFTSVAADQVRPEEVYLAPVWYQAFQTQPTPLLLLEDGEVP